MNKLVKGAITGAAGIALLLGGAGTFAAWNDANAIGGGSVQTGSLQFDGTPTVVGWFGADKTTALPSGYLAVPGDTVYYEATVKIEATGDNLKANFGIDTTAVKATLGISGDATATIDSVTGTGIEPGSGGVYAIDPQSTDITATVMIKVTFPDDATNVGLVGQNDTITLGNGGTAANGSTAAAPNQIPITLTQVL